MNETRAKSTLFAKFLRPSSLVLLLVIALGCGATHAAWAETMRVTVANDLGCTGTISVASTTGTTSSPISTGSNFEFNVTPLSRIVSAAIIWNVGNAGSMCTAYCQLYVNGVKHTSGFFDIHSWTTEGPQYSFTNIQGSNTGSQTMRCINDRYMEHLPAKYGEYPLP